MAFVLSLVVLALLYGYASRGFGWFPHALLDRAWNQARTTLPLGPDRSQECRVYDREGVRITRPEEVQPGVTLISSVWIDLDSEHGLKLLDETSVLDLLYANGLERHILKTKQHRREDITHLNDVEPLDAAMVEEYPRFEAGDLLVPLRNLHLVFVFDPESGRVKWHASHPLIRQHDPDFLGDGWVGIFDNNWDDTFRGRVLGGSRIVAVQAHTDSMRILLPTPDPNPSTPTARANDNPLRTATCS